MSESPTPEEDRGLTEQLVSYLDGELDGGAARHVEESLAADPHVRQELWQLDRAWQLLDKLPRTQVDESFTRSTVEMIAIQAEQELVAIQAEAPGRRRRAGLMALTLVFAAGAAGFAAVGAWSRQADEQLLRDLQVVENLDQYREVGDIEFLRGLKGKGLAAPNARPAAGHENVAAVAEETLAERRGRVAVLDPRDREQLAQNYERFQHMDREERDRLRQLNATLLAASDRDELQLLLQHYHEWFNALPANQRMTLAALPEDDRMRRVDEIRSFQTKQTQRLGAADLRVVGDWAHKHELQRKWFEARRNNTEPPPVPPDALAELRSNLTDEGRRALDAAQSHEELRQQLIAWFMQARRQAGGFGAGPGGPGFGRSGKRGPNAEETRKFLRVELSEGERNYLRALPPERMQSELRQLWREKHPKQTEAQRDRTPNRGGPRQRSAPDTPHGET